MSDATPTPAPTRPQENYVGVTTMLHKAARAYATNGVAIFPCQPRGKKPLTGNGFHDATTDLTQIDAWWTDNPDANIGVALGANGVFALDVDGPAGRAVLDDLEASYDQLPGTFQVVTGRSEGEGRHYLFCQPDGEPIRNRQIGDHLETRGDGGYVIAAPSVHPSGAHYTAEGKWDDITEPPAWLVALATKPPPDPQPIGDTYATVGADALAEKRLRGLAGNLALMPADSGRNNTLNHAAYTAGQLIGAGRLDRTHVEEVLTRAANLAGLDVDPDCGPKGIAATIASGINAGILDPDHTTPTVPATPAVTVVDHDHPEVANELDRLYPPLDWEALWNSGIDDVDWIVEGIVETGRAAALFAPAKSGKSLFLLELSACVATGRPFAGQDIPQPRTVLYIDREMSPADVIDRLKTLGFEWEELDRLVYLSLPALPPLDTPVGGEHLHALATRHDAALIVLDTASRVVEGPENDADTYRAYYAHTGQRLKAAGVAVWRLDHAGKDLTRGQRGASAKNDDVDAVWKLTPRTGGRLTLKSAMRRTLHGLDDLDLVRNGTGRLEPLAGDPQDDELAELEEVIAALDAADMPLDWGRERVRKSTAGAAISVRNELLDSAIKFRRSRCQRPPGATVIDIGGPVPRPVPSGSAGDGSGDGFGGTS